MAMARPSSWSSGAPPRSTSVKAAGLVHSVYYDEGLPLEDCDLIAATSTYPLLIRSYQAAVDADQGGRSRISSRV